jgi:hypothetical protein
MTYDISRRKFQKLYILVAPYPTEKKDTEILKNSYRHGDSFPNNVLAELEISICGWKKTATRGSSWNSQRLSYQQKPIDWYYFQPTQPRKTVPLTLSKADFYFYFADRS